MNEADGAAILFVVLLNGTLERDVTVVFETASDSATQDPPGRATFRDIAIKGIATIEATVVTASAKVSALA